MKLPVDQIRQIFVLQKLSALQYILRFQGKVDFWGMVIYGD